MDDDEHQHGAIEAAIGVEMAPRADHGVGEAKERPCGESPVAGSETSEDGMAASAGNGPMSVPGNDGNEQCGEGAGVQGDGKKESGEGKEESKGSWMDWLGSHFSFMKVEDRTAAQEEEEADQNFVMGFLETEVFQGCMDQQTMLARESLRVEGYRSVEELRDSNLSIASLVAKGVRRRPQPHCIHSFILTAPQNPADPCSIIARRFPFRMHGQCMQRCRYQKGMETTKEAETLIALEVEGRGRHRASIGRCKACAGAR